MSESVQLTLSKNKALVLFEFLSRISSSGDWSVEDSAEIGVLGDIEAQLEKTLAEPFSPDYNNLLEAARDAVRDPKGTNAIEEQAAGRLAFWLAPKDIKFVVDEWRKIPETESELVRDSWARIAFRAMSALHKVGISSDEL